MSLDLIKEKGIPLEKQKFDWHDIVRVPTSKLDDDAFTRVRIILMNGIESEAVRFQHACARMNKDFQLALIQCLRVTAGDCEKPFDVNLKQFADCRARRVQPL